MITKKDIAEIEEMVLGILSRYIDESHTDYDDFHGALNSDLEEMRLRQSKHKNK